MAAAVTVNDVLDGHVALDVECLDRIYLNGYVPNLQVGGQVVVVHDRASGLSDPVAGDHGEDRHRVPRGRWTAFAEDNHIPVVRFGKDDRKIEVMRPYLAAQAATGRSGVAAIGVAQEFQKVFAATKRAGRQRGSVVLVHQGRPAGDLLLLLPLGRRFRAGVHQDLRLLPVPDQGLAQRPRVGQTAGRQGRDRVHRAVQRVRHLRRSRRAAGDLRPARPGHDRGVLRTLVVVLPLPLTEHDRAAGLLVGAVDAPDRDLAHPGVRRAAPRPRVLRGAGRRQPRHRPPRHCRADLPPAADTPRPARRRCDCVSRPRSSPAAPRSPSTPSTSTPASSST